MYENNDKEMKLWEHLEELRRVAFKSLGVLLLTTVISFFFVDDILRIFIQPINSIKQDNPDLLIRQILTTPFDGVIIKMKVSFLAGVITGFPFIICFLWNFIKPGLKKREKKLFLPILILATLAFIFGIICAYFLLIPTVSALVSFRISSAENLWTLKDFINFEFFWMLGGGIICELPVFIVIITKLGIIKVELLKRIRPYYIIAAFVVAAVITPTTDPFTLCLVAFPMVFLYEIGIFIAEVKNKQNKTYGE
ncbi:MAG: twin-arginine translocase subunit TatC [Victivallales bacterium]|nr:twin-arginine translocase subunit TatC [Victivallales bacterium]MCF7889405.1 twin-arginine translocase subunit TatC [Victivallales bacterium]